MTDYTRAAYIAPKEIGSKAMSVLYADGSEERVRAFRVKSSGEGYQFRIVRTSSELDQTLNEPKIWDLLLHSLYLGNWNEDIVKKFTPPVIEAHKAGRLRGVICTATIQKDATLFIEALRKAGVPCTYVPHNYNKPNEHAQYKLEGIKYFEGAK